MDETKKYIIEFSEDPHTIRLLKLKNGDKYPVTEFKTVTPYTEPDMEQVREDAFKNGYDAACKDIDIKSKTNAAYRKGLEDAWDAARTLWNTPNRKEIFGHTAFNTVLTTLTAQETIEKIRQYEQEKEEINVGDEVTALKGKAIVTSVEDASVRYIYPNGRNGVMHKNMLTKTGRHFPEIAEVLQKMRES